ncbi:MAG: hypothetical protein WBQ78_01760 [Gammaproteobacteria bacterium]
MATVANRRPREAGMTGNNDGLANVVRQGDLQGYRPVSPYSILPLCRQSKSIELIWLDITNYESCWKSQEAAFVAGYRWNIAHKVSLSNLPLIEWVTHQFRRDALLLMARLLAE